MAASNTREQSTQSNYESVRVTAFHADLTVDFDARVLRGVATYTARVEREDVCELVLDTNHIHTHGVKIAGASVAFTLADEVEPFGRALHIPISHSGVGSTVVVSVEYSTTDASSALQWLTPAQTAGKAHPYVFTQCQAIHARSMIPCQDTPFVKATYTANVTVPAPMVAVMSALSEGEPTVNETGHRVFRFNQPVPMPSYLVALAVGNLASREIGPRTRVYAEPEVVEAAAFEFAETEDFINTGEALLGPYVWGRYDILCLPPSFPYGGMENPCLTFVTPTLIAGDRSLADVVAHEIAHSWTGNLVGPTTWSHFWLNEGWTMMVQRKILGRLQGDAAFDFDAFSGELALNDSLDTFMSRGLKEFTKLVPDLKGIDPDDAFSSVPYEKGFYLLYYLQSLVGVPAFEAFMHDYIQTFKFESLTSAEFQQFFTRYFAEGRHTLSRVGHAGSVPRHDGNTTPAFNQAEITGLLDAWRGAAAAADAAVAHISAEERAAAASHAIDVSRVDWDAWFYGVGAPPVKNTYDSSQRIKVDSYADLWVQDSRAAAAATATTGTWSAPQWIAFMERLVATAKTLSTEEPPRALHPELLRALDKAFNFSGSRNSEIRCFWAILSIKSGLEERLPAILEFLTGQGRMKYVRPIFRELLRTSFGRPVALDTYKTHGPAYHPICAKMIGVDIEAETAKPAVDPSKLSLAGSAPQSSEVSARSTHGSGHDHEQPGSGEIEEEGSEAEEIDEEDDEEGEDEVRAVGKKRSLGLGLAAKKKRERAMKAVERRVEMAAAPPAAQVATKTPSPRSPDRSLPLAATSHVRQPSVEAAATPVDPAAVATKVEKIARVREARSRGADAPAALAATARATGAPAPVVSADAFADADAFPASGRAGAQSGGTSLFRSVTQLPTKVWNARVGALQGLLASQAAGLGLAVAGAAVLTYFLTRHH